MASIPSSKPLDSREKYGTLLHAVLGLSRHLREEFYIWATRTGYAEAEEHSNLGGKKSHTFHQGPPILLYFELAANLGILLYYPTVRVKF
jgi:hypothetical protein